MLPPGPHEPYSFHLRSADRDPKSAAAAVPPARYTAQCRRNASASLTRAIFLHFKNKEEILFACHEYSLDKMLALMSDIQAESTSPETQLRRLMLAFVHLILDDLHGTALTLDPEALSPPLLKRVIVKRDQFDHVIRDIIQQGIDQGVFKPGDPKMIEFAMMGAVNWIPKWFDPAGEWTSDQILMRSQTTWSAD